MGDGGVGCISRKSSSRSSTSCLFCFSSCQTDVTGASRPQCPQHSAERRCCPLGSPRGSRR
jgi:hypothetical protein